jgi:glutathione S-transferase
MSDVVIHGVPGSPYVRAALMGCVEKGLSYQFARMGFGDSRTPEHLARHPFGRVPSFEHGGFRLYETQAILRYVDAAFPGPSLIPVDIHAQARMNQIVGIVDWYVFPDVTAKIGFNRIVAPLLGLPADEAAVAAALPKAKLCLGELERLLGGKTFMADETLSIADLMLAPQMDFLAETPEGAVLMETYPRLSAWLGRMLDRPSMAGTTWETLAKAA